MVSQFVLGARRSWLLSGARTWRAESPSSGLLYAIDWRPKEFLVDVSQQCMTADFSTTWHYIWLPTFRPHPPPPCSSLVFWFCFVFEAGSGRIGSNRPTTNTQVTLPTKEIRSLSFLHAASAVSVHWTECPEFVHKTSVCYFGYYTFKVLNWNSQTFQLCVRNAPLNQTVLAICQSEFSAFNPVTGKTFNCII